MLTVCCRTFSSPSASDRCSGGRLVCSLTLSLAQPRGNTLSCSASSSQKFRRKGTSISPQALCLSLPILASGFQDRTCCPREFLSRLCVSEEVEGERYVKRENNLQDFLNGTYRGTELSVFACFTLNIFSLILFKSSNVFWSVMLYTNRNARPSRIH